MTPALAGSGKWSPLAGLIIMIITDDHFLLPLVLLFPFASRRISQERFPVGSLGCTTCNLRIVLGSRKTFQLAIPEVFLINYDLNAVVVPTNNELCK